LSKTLEIEIDDPAFLVGFFGVHRDHLSVIEQAMDVCIGIRGNRIFVKGNEDGVNGAIKIIRRCETLSKMGVSIEANNLIKLVTTMIDEPSVPIEEINGDVILYAPGRRVVAPKSHAQKLYIDAIRQNEIIFSIGPAGTGKTYLAVAMALSYIQKKRFRRIILTRPAVEAGEKLGFLPGDLVEKVNPYLRPLYDALNDMMEVEKSRAFIEKGIIEVAPLAFMRGRTLNSSFIILDEAQNTTIAQMQMFLTRLGFDSKAVIAGDITQIDIPKEFKSGLVDAEERLRDIPGVKFCYFTEKDVVRHPIVQEIIRRYRSV